MSKLFFMSVTGDDAAHGSWSGRYRSAAALSRVMSRVVPDFAVHRVSRPRNVQLLRDDAQLLAVNRRPQSAVQQTATGDAEGRQPSAEDQSLPSLSARCDDWHPRRRTLPLRRPSSERLPTFAGLCRQQPTWRRILWL